MKPITKSLVFLCFFLSLILMQTAADFWNSGENSGKVRDYHSEMAKKKEWRNHGSWRGRRERLVTKGYTNVETILGRSTHLHDNFATVLLLV
ncbi:hypothetical protein AMTRI_Chr03g145290 [Amborella trichopoda]